MENDTPPSPGDSRWIVEPVRPGTVRITGSRDVSYHFEVLPGSLRIEAYDGEVLAETSQVIRGVHEVTVIVAGPSGRTLAAISIGDTSATTRLVHDDDETLVESSLGDHGRRLREAFAERQISGGELIHELTDQMRRNARLRTDIKAATSYDEKVLPSKVVPNTIHAACAAVCFLCSLGQFEFCVACAICIEI